jgi:hypothetical protein
MRMMRMMIMMTMRMTMMIIIMITNVDDGYLLAQVFLLQIPTPQDSALTSNPDLYKQVGVVVDPRNPAGVGMQALSHWLG